MAVDVDRFDRFILRHCGDSDFDNEFVDDDQRPLAARQLDDSSYKNANGFIYRQFGDSFPLMLTMADEWFY